MLREARQLELIEHKGHYQHYKTLTLPETNSSPLKIDHRKRIFLLETIIFRGYVRFLECKEQKSGLPWEGTLVVVPKSIALYSSPKDRHLFILFFVVQRGIMRMLFPGYSTQIFHIERIDLKKVQRPYILHPKIEISFSTMCTP